jgi:hypothetical protein
VACDDLGGGTVEESGDRLFLRRAVDENSENGMRSMVRERRMKPDDDLQKLPISQICRQQPFSRGPHILHGALSVRT